MTTRRRAEGIPPVGVTHDTDFLHIWDLMSEATHIRALRACDSHVSGRATAACYGDTTARRSWMSWRTSLPATRRCGSPLGGRLY